MEEEVEVYEFENDMRGVQTALGWLYLPVHCVLLPLMVGIYALLSPEPVSAASVNLTVYGVSAGFVLLVLGTFLRRSFDRLLDNLVACLTAVVVGLLMAYAMELPISFLLFYLERLLGGNPNEAEILLEAEENRGVMMAVSIFIGPLVEEALFRGVIFGSLRGKSKWFAYGFSAVLFGLNHVWSYAAGMENPWLLLYGLQYIPFSLAAAWSYDRTGSLWTPVFLHMLFNTLAWVLPGG